MDKVLLLRIKSKRKKIENFIAIHIIILDWVSDLIQAIVSSAKKTLSPEDDCKQPTVCCFSIICFIFFSNVLFSTLVFGMACVGIRSWTTLCEGNDIDSQDIWCRTNVILIYKKEKNNNDIC